MFSRAGKTSSSKYRILLEREFILNKKFKLKRPERPDFKNNKMPVDEINAIASKEQTKIEKVKKSKEAKAKHLMRSHSGNYMFKVQSRNDYYEANRNKDIIPPPGWYNISYSRTEKHCAFPNFKIQASHTDLFKSTSSSFYPASPDKPFRHVPAIIPFQKQLRRFMRKFDNHEKMYNPDSSCIRKKVRTVDMNKTLPRKKDLFKSPEFSLDYDTNKEIIMPDLGKVLNFDNMSRRKSLFSANK